MERFDLKLLRNGKVAAARSVEVDNARALWPRLTAFAECAGSPRSHIRVTDSAGGFVLLVDVASARRLPRSSRR